MSLLLLLLFPSFSLSLSPPPPFSFSFLPPPSSFPFLPPFQFDTNKSGALEADQLGQFMQDMAHHDGHGSMDPADLKSAVAFVMKAADADNSGSIDLEELKHAVTAWKNWSHSSSRLSEKVKDLLKTYDTDMSGSLDRTQLTEMLTALNEGDPVLPAEVDSVIAGADKRGNGAIDMEEIYPALALWYQISDGDQDQADGLVVVKATGCHLKGGHCCVVS